MKRHPALQPFSRDHNVGLVYARRLERGDSIGEEFARLWQDELDSHFDDEETLLGPLATDELSARLVAEHGAIRALASDLASADLVELGRRLGEHIRWEERVLFPAIEATASQARLRQLAVETARIEARRAASTWAPRRGELNRTPTQEREASAPNLQAPRNPSDET